MTNRERTMTQDDPALKDRAQPADDAARTDGMSVDDATPAQPAARGPSTAAMAEALEEQDTDGGTAAATARAGDATRSADAHDGGRNEPLFAADDTEQFRNRWMDVQTGFVDAPRQAVEQADQLVAEVMQRLVQGFADERQRLEAQWGQGEEPDTEGLRMTLRRYRSFFERLLAA
jgi:hypothetical protein